MNILAIGAHFDDIELGCGGSLARHVSLGDNVYVYVATTSGYANPRNKIIRSHQTAMKEALKAKKILGIKELICGKFSTFEVEFVERLNTDIIDLVESQGIERVYTHWTGDVHHDHQSVAKASIHSCRRIPCVLMYRSNWYQSSENFQGRYYVDVSEYLDIKEKAIRAYVTEMKRTKNNWIRYVRNEAELQGQRIGVQYAECFEVLKCLER